MVASDVHALNGAFRNRLKPRFGPIFGSSYTEESGTRVVSISMSCRSSSRLHRCLFHPRSSSCALKNGACPVDSSRSVFSPGTRVRRSLEGRLTSIDIQQRLGMFFEIACDHVGVLVRRVASWTSLLFRFCFLRFVRLARSFPNPIPSHVRVRPFVPRVLRRIARADASLLPLGCASSDVGRRTLASSTLRRPPFVGQTAAELASNSERGRLGTLSSLSFGTWTDQAAMRRFDVRRKRAMDVVAKHADVVHQA